MKRQLIGTFISLGLLLSAVPPLAAQAASLPSLAGSWQLTFTPLSPTASVVTPFQGLATFTSDGSVVETDATEVVPMMSATGITVHGTPGHGIWQRGPAIGNLFIRFINLLVNQNETLHARKIVTITGALDSTGNHFSGNYSNELVGPAGRVIRRESGTVTAERIPHPLLP